MDNQSEVPEDDVEVCLTRFMSNKFLSSVASVI